jgi:hypothetical protein
MLCRCPLDLISCLVFLHGTCPPGDGSPLVTATLGRSMHLPEAVRPVAAAPTSSVRLTVAGGMAQSAVAVGVTTPQADIFTTTCLSTVDGDAASTQQITSSACLPDMVELAPASPSASTPVVSGSAPMHPSGAE